MKDIQQVKLFVWASLQLTPSILLQRYRLAPDGLCDAASNPEQNAMLLLMYG